MSAKKTNYVKAFFASAYSPFLLPHFHAKSGTIWVKTHRNKLQMAPPYASFHFNCFGSPPLIFATEPLQRNRFLRERS